MSAGSTPPPPETDFDSRLRAAQKAAQGGANGSETDGKQPKTPMGWAFRIGVDLISALVVGVGIGWLLDDWLGTRPWMMILFFLFGAGAGIVNVYRTVNGLGMAVGYKPASDTPAAKAPESDQSTGSAAKGGDK